MNHGAEPGLRDEPFSGKVLLKRYRLPGTKMDAHPTPFTGYFVHYKIITDSFKATDLLTLATFITKPSIDKDRVAAMEIFSVLYSWPQNKVKVSGINIAIGHYFILCQRSKAGGNDRFTGSSLATDNSQLFHDWIVLPI
jgi:hypothetical protein